MTGRYSAQRIESTCTYLIFGAAAFFLSSAVGCNSSSTSTTTPAETSSSSSAAASAGTPRAAEVDHKHPVVRIETNQGAITVRLDAVKAPGTVRNFLNYAGEGFYDNTLVHYIDPGKMILAGGYSVDGQLKPTRPPIRNEAHNGLKNVRGTIAMARDQALIDNATSQFFINLADAPQRDHQGPAPEQYGYCVFGELTEGLEVAQRISESATTDQGGDLRQVPQPAVVITAIRVLR